MTAQPPQHPDELDAQLAAFTDALLQRREGSATPPLSDDPELRALEEMVIQMHQTLTTADPDPATARAIQSTLTREWQRRHPPRPAEPWWASWQRRLLPSRTQRPLFALAMAAAVVLLALLVAPALPTQGSLPGSALGALPATPIIAGLALALGGLLWWAISSKR